MTSVQTKIDYFNNLSRKYITSVNEVLIKSMEINESFCDNEIKILNTSHTIVECVYFEWTKNRRNA